MKKNVLWLWAVAGSLLLTGCGKATPSSSFSSGSESADSMTSKSDEPVMSWKAGFGQAIQEVFGFSFDFPFPKGFTEQHTYKVEESKDGPFLYIEDKAASNLVSTYGQALLDFGFQDGGTPLEGDDSIHVYKENFGDRAVKATAQISYDQETGMAIYLSKEEGVYEDASFPYSRIDSHFGLDGYAITAVPAFDVLENTPYCTHINEQNQFEIFGKVRDGEAAKKAYETSLTGAGYALEMNSFGEVEAKKENAPLSLRFFTKTQEGSAVFYLVVEKAPVLANAWSKEIKASMVQILGDYVLPFPVGLKDDASFGVDNDGNHDYFYVRDMNCGNLSMSYGQLLLKEGFFVLDKKDAMTRYDMERVDDDVNIEVEYYGGLFSIYAWVEKDDRTEFPYIKMAKNFGILLNKAEEIPEFRLAKGQKYDAYGAEDKSSYYIGGYFDSNITDEDYERDYEALLRRRGFNVPEYQEGVKVATKVGLDFSLEFSAANHYFLLQLISTIK